MNAGQLGLMMTDWKPKLVPTTDLLSLSLTNVEGFTASRVDGLTTLAQLAELTGQSPEQVTALLERLVAQGAVLPPPEASAPDVPETSAPDVPEASAPDVPEASAPAAHSTHLKLYRDELYRLPADARVKLAGTSSGAVLGALCYDPLPQVIRKLMDNPRAGLIEARLIAAHHQNPAGLEALLSRADLLRDSQVQRLLFRNPQLNESQLRRMTQARRLLELWKLSVSRETTTQTRSSILKVLRSRFPNASAEEKVELLFTTEGRVLASLSGLSIDAHTSALLCARTYPSVMLVQSLARWSATPAALIAHLYKQPLVMRQPRLKTMLEQHPNAPPAPKS